MKIVTPMRFQRFTVCTGLATALLLTGCNLGGSTDTPVSDPANTTETTTAASTNDSVYKPEEPATPNPSSTGTVLLGSTGQTQITLPDRWSEDRELHASAEVQASNRPAEMYTIILSESKADFGSLLLEEHSEITRELLTENLSDVTQSQPTRLTVNGHPALEYEIRASIDNIEVVYIHTTVETPTNFHQILAWTLPNNFAANQQELRQVIQSFQEVGQ